MKRAIATGLIIGKTLIDVAAGPKLGAEQIEQEWWEVCDFAGCEWTACTVPIVKTSAMHNTQSTWAIWPRFAVVRIMASRFLESNPELGERPVTLGNRGQRLRFADAGAIGAGLFHPAAPVRLCVGSIRCRAPSRPGIPSASALVRVGWLCQYSARSA